MATRKTVETSPTLITTPIEENLDKLLLTTSITPTKITSTNADELLAKTNELNDETNTMEMIELIVEDDDDDHEENTDNNDMDNIDENNKEHNKDETLEIEHDVNKDKDIVEEVVVSKEIEKVADKEIVVKEEGESEEKSQLSETDDSVKHTTPKLLSTFANIVLPKKESLVNSENEESSSSNTGKIRPALIRGRKSIKELKLAIKEELSNKLKEFEENQELAMERKLEQQQQQHDEIENNNKDNKRTNITLKQKSNSLSPVKEEKKIIEESKEDIKNKIKDKTDDDKDKDNKCEVMSGDETNISTIEITPSSCRITRKSAAQEIAVNTRITRNRQNSSGSLGRPETPPSNLNTSTVIASTSMAARTRRSIINRKNATNAMETSPPSSAKRKRLIEENLSGNELVAKHIKMEVKDDVEMDEDDASTQEIYHDLAKIKQELSDGGESIIDSTPIITTVRGRPRGRKSQTPTIVGGPAVSPSTRTTRHTKVTSQSPTFSTSSGGSSSEAKRRRTVTGNTMTRSSMSLMKTNPNKQAVAHMPDEDSKDSLDDTAATLSSASSLISAGVALKIEKHGQESAAEEESACEESESMTDDRSSANGVAEPLTVDTSIADVETAEVTENCESSENVELATSSNAGGSDKAASLSPDMVSEGVNVMSVKQFYKKAEFLENNLGIEEDPKLGEIVQKGTTSATPTATVSDVAINDNAEEEEEEQQQQQQQKEENVYVEHENVVSDAADATEELKSIDKIKSNITKNATVDESMPSVMKPSVINEQNEKKEHQEKLPEEEVNQEEEEEDEEDEALCGRLIIQEDDDDNNDNDDDNAADSINQDIKVSVDRKKDNIAETNNNKKTKNECDKIKAKLKAEEQNDDEKMHDDNNDDDDVVVDANNVEKKNVKKYITNEMENKNLIELQGFNPNDDDEVLNIFDMEMNKLNIKNVVEEKKDKIVNAASENHKKKQQVKEQDKLIKSQDNDISNDSNNSKAENEKLYTTTNESKPTHMPTVKDDDANSMKSGQSTSTDTNSWTTLDCDYDEETLRQKEKHLQNLGLLTHKAAEKRRQEYKQNSAAAVEAATQRTNNKRNGKAASTVATIAASATEYTGTLKTVIKLNRNSSGGTTSNGGTGSGSGRKSSNKDSSVRRQPLKMTFQKGRGRGQGNTDRSNDAQSNGEDAYYTIQNENEGGPKNSTCKNPHAEHNITNVHSHGRKSYNRSNNSTNYNNINNITNSTTASTNTTKMSKGGVCLNILLDNVSFIL